MTSKPATNKKLFLVNAVIFVGFGIHFFLLNDRFFTVLLVFTALLNIISFFRISPKVGDQSIIINFFNGLLLFISAYNYGEFDQLISTLVCGSFSFIFFYAAARQYYLRSQYRKGKKRKLKRFR